jgi:hypothetical protein
MKPPMASVEFRFAANKVRPELKSWEAQTPIDDRLLEAAE